MHKLYEQENSIWQNSNNQMNANNNYSNSNNFDNNFELNNLDAIPDNTDENNDAIINNFDNTQKVKNIQSKQPYFLVEKKDSKNTSIANKSTKGITFTTKNTGNIIKKGEEPKIEINDNNNEEKKKREFDYRNYPDILLRNFFKDILKFIDSLIEEVENKNPERNRVSHLNMNIYLEDRTQDKLEQLDKTLIYVLTNINKEKKQNLINDNEKHLVNNSKLFSKYNKKECFINIYNVLNLNIRKLLDIYLKKEIPKEKFYNKFHKFEDCDTYKKNKQKEELMNYAKNYEQKLKNKIENDNNKKGPKCSK